MRRRLQPKDQYCLPTAQQSLWKGSEADTWAAALPTHSPAELPPTGLVACTRPEITSILWEGALPAMRPARPVHLLRLTHSHRRQAASHSLVLVPKFRATSNGWEAACCGRRSGDVASKTHTPAVALPTPSPAELPPTGLVACTRPEITSILWEGALPAMRPARPTHLLRLLHSHRQPLSPTGLRQGLTQVRTENTAAPSAALRPAHTTAARHRP